MGQRTIHIHVVVATAALIVSACGGSAGSAASATEVDPTHPPSNSSAPTPATVADVTSTEPSATITTPSSTTSDDGDGDDAYPDGESSSATTSTDASDSSQDVDAVAGECPLTLTEIDSITGIPDWTGGEGVDVGVATGCSFVSPDQTSLLTVSVASGDIATQAFADYRHEQLEEGYEEIALDDVAGEAYAYPFGSLVFAIALDDDRFALIACSGGGCSETAADLLDLALGRA